MRASAGRAKPASAARSFSASPWPRASCPAPAPRPIILVCLSLNVMLAGIVAVSMISLGMGATVTVIGAVAILAKRGVVKVSASGGKRVARPHSRAGSWRSRARASSSSSALSSSSRNSEEWQEHMVSAPDMLGLAQGGLVDLHHDSRGPRLRDDSLPSHGHLALGPHPELRAGSGAPADIPEEPLPLDSRGPCGGAFVPICECGTVPLARRLRQKGLPLSTAVAFLLAAPLANPMTIISTFVAFKGTGYASSPTAWASDSRRPSS